MNLVNLNLNLNPLPMTPEQPPPGRDPNSDTSEPKQQICHQHANTVLAIYPQYWYWKTHTDIL